MIPALPFLAVPLAITWPKIRRVALVAIGLSGIVAVGAATTDILTAKNQQVLPEMVRRMAHHEFLPTIWSMGLGRFGVVVYLVSVVAVGAALVAELRRDAGPVSESVAAADLGL